MINSGSGVRVVKGTGWPGGVELEWVGPAEGMFESSLEGDFPCRYLGESVLGLSGTKVPGLARVCPPGFMCWQFGAVPLGRAGSSRFFLKKEQVAIKGVSGFVMKTSHLSLSSI